MSTEKYNTHLASEFYVLSALHRLGAEATLTLGNRKAVDIVVVQEAGKSVTIDVKGLAGTTSWPVDTVKERPNHFLVFVCFKNRIADLTAVPEVYVVPSERVEEFTYSSPKGRKTVELSWLRKGEGPKFKDAWDLILHAPAVPALPKRKVKNAKQAKRVPN